MVEAIGASELTSKGSHKTDIRLVDDRFENIQTHTQYSDVYVVYDSFVECPLMISMKLTYLPSDVFIKKKKEF